jgi:predicted O-linked N-acetylglucosamine transferase (SPINDLY family)
MNPIEALQRAALAHRGGQLSEAERLYNEVLKADRRQFDALHMLGIVHCQRGNFSEAAGLFTRALEVRPQSAEVHADLGRVHFELGRSEQAAASYRQSLAINPNFVLAHSNYSIILRKSGRPQDALAHCDKALALQPNYPDALINRANALFDLDRYEEALTAYDRGLALAPRLAQAWLGRANVCCELRRLGDARIAIDKALALNPHAPEAWLGLGNILSARRSYEEALAGYDKALALSPQLADAWIGRISALTAQKRHPEAVASYDKLLAIKPDAEYAPGWRLLARMQICDWADWSAECERILAGVRQDRRVANPFVLLATPATASDQLRCARAYTSAHFPAASAPIWQGVRERRDKIKVAYLSSDFRQHPVSYLLAGLIERHDRSRFSPIAISFGPDDDSDIRRRLRGAFDAFVDVDAQSDLDTAKRMRALEVDIAVDLMGFTQEGRPGILAHRPAPVQVAYLGYPGTTGAGHIDYLLADRYVVPEEQRACYAERVVHLPDAYQPNDRRPIADQEAMHAGSDEVARKARQHLRLDPARRIDGRHQVREDAAEIGQVGIRGACHGAASLQHDRDKLKGPSTGKSALVEEGLLLRRRRATERGVAVRKPAEAADDVGVVLGIAHALGVVGEPAQGGAAFLIRQRLRMHERQVEEAPLRIGEGGIKAAGDSALGDAAGECIRHEGPRIATKHVARKLVEGEQQREGTVRGRFPIGQLSRSGCFVKEEKPGADFIVDQGVPLEPALRPEPAPECNDVGRRRQRE